MRLATLGLLAAMTFAPVVMAKDHKNCKCDTACMEACHNKAGEKCTCKCGCKEGAEGKTCSKCNEKHDHKGEEKK